MRIKGLFGLMLAVMFVAVAYSRSAMASTYSALFSSVDVSGVATAVTTLLISLLVMPVLFYGYRKIKQSFIK